MARQPRLDMLGALNHIRMRGINRSPIFLHQEEKQNFLNRVGEEITEGHCSA